MDKLRVELWESPKDVTIIEGFPGFGMVGIIATEAIIDFLKPRLIGRITSNKLPALIAVHDGKVVEPLGVFYDPKNNLVLLHAVTNIAGFEWDLCDAVLEVARLLKAKEIVSMEGIGTLAQLPAGSGKGREAKPEGGKTYFYANNDPARKKFDSLGVKQLSEGIIVGVTGSLVLKAGDKMRMSCVFGETHSGFPDSRAAASVIGIIDKYFGLNVPSEPLMKKAAEFEGKLEDLFGKIKNTSQEKEKLDRIPYIE
ncbi:MAG TPA: proteasome assembly chaperone family protein [Nanoarchaeota archaeon]|nr:proteasome assembly chaperone family protein [Nanoarchaeota archaeon]HIH34421.1 proteasome assembly chaperone family protein [Nanoarchaeota archaeon]HIH51594.1 proteasome assembly chaperone family protein [Nanoarchaeota archaeon]HIH65602.1 proteasome assembly chaperone family protein [Nanoarchaeota archaeon]